MGALFDFLDFIVDIGDIYTKHGVKGCLLSVLAVVLVLGGIIALVLMLGE